MRDEWLPAISATIRPSTHATYQQACARVSEIRRRRGAAPQPNRRPSELALRRDGAGGPVDSHPAPDALHDPPGAPRRRPLGQADAEPRGQCRPALGVSHARPGVDRRRTAAVPRPRSSDRLFALWRLAATTGMRRGELLGLSLLALDLDGARLRVERQFLKSAASSGRRSRAARSEPSRSTPKQSSLCAATSRRNASSGLSPAPRTRTTISSSANELGRPLNPNALSKTFIRHRKAAGVPVGSLHVLRHTAATLALRRPRRCRCMSWRGAWATIRRSCLRHMRTCCLTQMRWQPKQSPRRSLTNRGQAAIL